MAGSVGVGVDHRSSYIIGTHNWLKRRLGRPAKCVECGTTEGVEWANISKTYKRDTSDYQGMCRSCHRKFDLVLATHCKRGHEYTPENTWIRPPRLSTQNPSRSCRTCARENQLKRKGERNG